MIRKLLVISTLLFGLSRSKEYQPLGKFAVRDMKQTVAVEVVKEPQKEYGQAKKK